MSVMMMGGWGDEDRGGGGYKISRIFFYEIF